MKSKIKWFIFVGLTIVLAACSADTGSLEVRANGEDFVRQGFVSKDGWEIAFDNVFVTLSDVNAYKTDPPYDASNGDDPEGVSVSIAPAQTIDLAAGDADADPILLDTLEAETGQYNAIGWDMINGDNGYTLQMIGTAVKDGTEIPFDIKIDETYNYVCGEFVGDERKGFVDADSTGDIEMTFHFDHVFGDADSDADDPLNVGALGFDPLAELADSGSLDITQDELSSGLSSENYAVLLDTLATLGHVGEGHCFEATNGYTAHDG